MTSTSPKERFEIQDENDLESARLGCKENRTCTLSRSQVLLCVIVAILLVVVMGILMAMFGPGSTDLKYRDPADCTGKEGYFVVSADPSAEL